ncbi:uncharacterized protein KY384_004928 [Bacidia gigantensis]|uniref:uncharacterized protein n=1 Tax=Bacidia gigantensis TaxID=2732470 RepID=UPI001D0434E9|nr:uncharacterized protein KY384_004928 [Bacidia gigantensis]KAG8530426.1 hypothetical protein KY384_004928 [Bacidia gigantensis]
MEIQPTSSEGTGLAEDLLERCQKLLDELQSFHAYLDAAKSRTSARLSERNVDIRQFQSLVMTERNSLQKGHPPLLFPFLVFADPTKLSAADPTADKTIHTLKSSNLPFYSAVWESAKRSKALVNFHRRFYWDERPKRRSQQVANSRGALVDIVTEDGDEWIKISTMSEQRLLFELAKARWEVEDSSDEHEDGDRPSLENDRGLETDEFEKMELCRTASDLVRASHANRIHYEHPRVRMVLPKIPNPPSTDLIPLFERIQSTGTIIELGDLPPNTANSQNLETNVFPRLLPSPYPPLTSTINVDCTILLALVSELSYSAQNPVRPDYNAAIRRQIEVEANERLLVTHLWPGLANRDLVCTVEAAKRMREIVDTIGIPNERIRTELIMEDGRLGPAEADPSNRQPCDLRKSLQQFSDHQVPESLRIPIRVEPAPTASDISKAIHTGRLPAIAERVLNELTDINRSVFFYGWFHGYTTVSSNRTVAKAIENTIEKNGKCDKGPEIWLREPARSLLGKEKERRK